MSSHSQNEQLLAACETGDLARVRELFLTRVSSTPEEHIPLLEMITLKAAEKGHAEVVRFCLERGARPDYGVINAASEFPEVFKVLITVGGLDVNYDFESAGDMLINAVWELKVRSVPCGRLYPGNEREKIQNETKGNRTKRKSWMRNRG